MRFLLDRLLNDPDPVEFVVCYLVVQSLKSVTEKLVFRIKKNWTGRDVKSEISRLYSIPIDYQVIIVNDRVVKDDEPLSDYNIRPKEQIIYTFLRKRPIQYRNSGIRIKDILPDPEIECQDDVPIEDTIESSVDYMLTADTHPLGTSSKHLDMPPKSARDSGFYSCPPSVAADGMASNSTQQKKSKRRRGRRK